MAAPVTAGMVGKPIPSFPIGRRLSSIAMYNASKGDSAMLKAVLRKGAIIPLEPLPPEWEEGTTLEVAMVDAPQLDIDAWAITMNRLCADSSPEDEEEMRRAIQEHRQQAKTRMRRDMGLPA
jgi:hypothetical protein